MDDDFWFPAKRYGWGRGLPVKWQGWVTLLAYIGVLAAGVPRFPPRQSIAGFLTVVLLSTLGFVFVCWWKGEPPRWRWGED